MKKASSVLLLFLMAFQWGWGCQNARAADAGPKHFFQLAHQDGRWWLISPDGGRFVVLGVVHAGEVYRSKDSLLHKHFGGDVNKTNACVLGLLERTNSNSLGYDTPEQLKSRIPYFAQYHALPISEWQHESGALKFADVFDPAVEKKMRAGMRAVCEGNRDNPNLIGYYWTDMPMWDMARAELIVGQNWVHYIRELPQDSAGKQVYVDFLLERYRGRLEALEARYEVEPTREAMLRHKFPRPVRLDRVMNEDDREFLRLIARRYYSILGSETRKNDPRHLIFGDRYTNYVHPDEVIEEALPWIDVFSVQPDGAFDKTYFDKLHAKTGKPINICDHQVSFPVPGFNKVIWAPADSKQIALAQMDSFVREAFSQPYIIGYGRCQMIDHISPDGRIKIGLLNEEGNPKEELVAHLRAAYLEVQRKLHLGK